MLRQQRISLIFLLALLVALDRWLKLLALAGQLPLVRNEGIAFSLPVLGAVAPIVIAAVLIGLIWFAVRCWRRGESWAGWAWIIAGGLSNVYDRFRYGAVIDYVRFGDGAVNLADALVVVGIFWLLHRELTARRTRH